MENVRFPSDGRRFTRKTNANKIGVIIPKHCSTAAATQVKKTTVKKEAKKQAELRLVEPLPSLITNW